LAHWFNVRPWEVDLLAPREVDAMVAWAKEVSGGGSG
jgi:hypothetical protein